MISVFILCDAPKCFKRKEPETENRLYKFWHFIG
jgi:hypothetical protein